MRVYRLSEIVATNGGNRNSYEKTLLARRLLPVRIGVHREGASHYVLDGHRTRRYRGDYDRWHHRHSRRAGDIIRWNLHLNDGSTTFDLNNSKIDASVFVVGSDVSATPSTLSFNFSSGDAGYLLFERDFSSGDNYYCDASNNGTCFENSQTVAADISTDALVSPFSGNIVIATAEAPEPTAAILLPMMLFGVAFVARKRITRQA